MRVVVDYDVCESNAICMGLAPEQSCPAALSSYFDACETMNH